MKDINRQMEGFEYKEVFIDMISSLKEFMVELQAKLGDLCMKKNLFKSPESEQMETA